MTFSYNYFNPPLNCGSLASFMEIHAYGLEMCTKVASYKRGKWEVRFK